MGRLTDIAALFAGYVRRLIGVLEGGQVPRWRSTNTDLLREYREEEGYLDPEHPLTRDEIYHRALDAAAKERPDGDMGKGRLDRVVDSLALVTAQPQG